MCVCVNTTIILQKLAVLRHCNASFIACHLNSISRPPMHNTLESIHIVLPLNYTDPVVVHTARFQLGLLLCVHVRVSGKRTHSLLALVAPLMRPH